MTPWIALVRHGPPAAPRPPWLAGRDLPEWWTHYDRAPLRPDAVAPPWVVRLAGEAAVLASSPLPRARTTAARLAPDREVREVPDAHEIGSWTPDCSLRLSAPAWSAIARLVWLTGRVDAAESPAAARNRAARLAERLDTWAQRDGPVLLVAHGLLNRWVSDALVVRGWSRRHRGADRYWNVRVHVRWSGTTDSRPGGEWPLLHPEV